MLIYKITNVINGKIYVGQTTRSEVSRWDEHKKRLNSNCHVNIHLQSAWNKYGEECFVFEVIIECETQEQLNLLEEYYINQYESNKTSHGYNKTSGGSNGKLSEETKAKISANRKGIKFSEEHRKKISEAQKGKVISQEQKLKISNAKKDKKLSEKHKENISKSKTGIPLSEETRDKLKKKIPWNKGLRGIVKRPDVALRNKGNVASSGSIPA